MEELIMYNRESVYNTEYIFHRMSTNFKTRFINNLGILFEQR